MSPRRPVGPRGICARCGKRIALRSDGTIRGHQPTLDQRDPASAMCPGVGYAPKAAR